MAETGRLWIGSIVIDCQKFDEMIAFWKAALGYEARQPPSENWTLITDPRGSGPNLAFQKVPESPGENYWFHLDLYSSDLEAEVQRLLGLGATTRQPAKEGFDYVTLADPDGNPFDIVDARGYAFGQRTD